MPGPGEITTRSASQTIREEANMQQVKRTHYRGSIKRIERKIDDDATFNNWSKGQLKEYLDKIKSDHSNLDEAIIQITCEEDGPAANTLQENEEMEEVVMRLKSKISDRLEELTKKDNEATPTNDANPKGFIVEVQATDAAGNIPNTWGTFDGDYAKWQSFRDRWLSIMHNNNKVKTIVKFQNLKAACIGAAAGAVGEWDLTDDNYFKAWDRLCTIYEDDYMQVQSFMQMLKKLPQMRKSSSRSIRNVIDTVQKHINGLKRYVKTDDGSPYAVFSVIDKMDTETYRAWEKHRRALAEANLQAIQQDAADAGENQNVTPNAGKYIPKWAELEQFLEGEVTIRVHAEKRGEVDSNHEQDNDPKPSTKRFKQYKKARNVKNKEGMPDFLQCALCPGIHPLYKCEAFKAMNLTGRRNHIRENDLCEKCVRPNHSGPCAKDINNKECPQCKPEIRFHNSVICPNSELKMRTAMLTQEDRSRKRKQYNNHGKGYQSKKRRTYNDKQGKSSESVPSAVHKLGEWSIVSNAIKQIRNKSEKSDKSDRGELKHTVVLATMSIVIEIENYSPSNCRALLDSGASICCITEQFIEENGYRTIKCQKLILGVSGPEIIKRKLVANIHPHFTNEINIKKNLYILKNLSGYYPNKYIDASKEQIMHLGLADVNFDIPAPIDALLSAEFYAEVMGTDLYRQRSGAIMQSTTFGHVILGKFKVKQNHLSDLPVLNILQSDFNEQDESLRNALTRFWEIEDTNKSECKEKVSEEGKATEKIFVETFYREKSGRYVVTIPIKPDCKGLGDSKRIAFKQFMQLERRLENEPEVKAKYVQFMREYRKLGYLQQACDKYDPKFAYWLPHHPIKKKFRVVVNASQNTTSGDSLNTIQMTGDKLQADLELQLMRFRKFKIGIATDVSKMFNNIGLNKKQWNLQRLFWREFPKDELKEYVITVVMFGLKSSPFNAVRTLKQCARDNAEKFPEAASVIENCFYMDDGIFGCNNVQKAMILCKEIEFVLRTGNFPLKTWVSNSKELESYMNAETKDELILGDDETKVLGVKWSKISDEFGIFVKELRMPINSTKRAILKEIASLYDPNGFIAPVVAKAKMLMQTIWKLDNIGWDDKVPKAIKAEWLDIYANLPLLSEFKIKRWLKSNAKTKLQIHAFCDASEKAYGTAIYVRAMDSKGDIHCTLLSAKSRVAPIKTVTIPRLELLGAVLLSEQLEAILETCQFDEQSVTCWTDSSIVLHWINKQPQDLKAFVANRVKIIQEKTKRFTWKHVSSQDNPADLVSRGMQIPDFLKSKLWLMGPTWLSTLEANWPRPKISVATEVIDEISKECKTQNRKKRLNHQF